MSVNAEVVYGFLKFYSILISRPTKATTWLQYDSTDFHELKFFQTNFVVACDVHYSFIVELRGQKDSNLPSFRPMKPIIALNWL